jgi:hypothetical protein
MKCETRVYEHFLQVRGRGLAMLLILLLPGCGVMTELSNTGRAPPLTPITNPTDAKNYQPVSMPMPTLPEAPQSPDSLWQSNARAFFKDQRASRVGDILTVLVAINDDANLKNNTAAARTGTSAFGFANFFGLENVVPTAPRFCRTAICSLPPGRKWKSIQSCAYCKSPASSGRKTSPAIIPSPATRWPKPGSATAAPGHCPTCSRQELASRLSMR